MLKTKCVWEKQLDRIAVIIAIIIAVVVAPALRVFGSNIWEKYRTGHGSGLTREDACKEANDVIQEFDQDICVERYRKGVMKSVKAGECLCPIQSGKYYHCRVEFTITCETR